MASLVHTEVLLQPTSTALNGVEPQVNGAERLQAAGLDRGDLFVFPGQSCPGSGGAENAHAPASAVDGDEEVLAGAPVRVMVPKTPIVLNCGSLDDVRRNASV